MLERESALAFWLLVPTLVLLTLFIAYPFVRGVWLSLTSSMVYSIPAQPPFLMPTRMPLLFATAVVSVPVENDP